MKIILAGSPEISIKAFEKIIKNFEVLAIVTQPDRPKGRGMKMIETPVSALGKKYGIKVYKPEKIKDITSELLDLNYDMFLTFAYGQWVPDELLYFGKYKATNIHGSLLPKYRGAAPIHYAILNGDKEIGITFMQMVTQMDAGDMYFKASEKIDEYTTTGQGFEIVSKLASDNIVEWLKLIEKGDYKATPQGEKFSLSPKIEKSFAQLKNDLTIEQATRKIRGLNPFPGAFILINNKRLKVFDVREENIDNSIELEFTNGKLYAVEYQWEGKPKKVLNI